MKPYLASILLLSLGLTVACGPAPEQPEPAAEAAQQAEDVAALDAHVEAFEAAANAGDAAALAALHTDDAIRMPPNEPSVIGKEAITAWFQTRFEQFTQKLTLSSEEGEVAGDWAFRRGTYTSAATPKAGGEPIQDDGKYLVIMQKQPDGSWKTFRAIWNSDNPLPGADG